MATINVSTWSELVTALTNHGNNDTIKLITDTDCNNEIPGGVDSTINCGSTAVTLTGDYIESGFPR